jgi:cytidine deaminase
MSATTHDVADRLLALAADAARQAYAPYSRLHVGAALETSDGGIVTGCNVENVSYGLTCCAERNAVFAAVGQRGPAVRIARIAVVAFRDDGGQQHVTPCGACRQVIRELAAPECEVVYTSAAGIVRTTLAELLPHAFGSDAAVPRRG